MTYNRPMSETVQKKQEGTTMEERFGKCPYATVQSLLSGKWAMLILHYLDEGTDAVQCAAACHAEDDEYSGLRVPPIRDRIPANRAMIPLCFQ